MIDIDRLADLVAEQVVSHLGESRFERWLTPAQLAERLQVDRSYVYEHAVALGARRLGSGPKARLRFRIEDVEAAIVCLSRSWSEEAEAAPVHASRRPRPARLGTSITLLPIRGVDERLGAHREANG